jgi:hypothetical protein
MVAVKIAQVVLLFKDLLLTQAMIRRALSLLALDGVQLDLQHTGVLLIDVDEGALWVVLLFGLLSVVRVVFE